MNIKSSRVENFKQGNPIYPGRLHGDSVYVALAQPIGQLIKISGKGRKMADILIFGISPIGHGHIMKLCADIYSGSIDVELF